MRKYILKISTGKAVLFLFVLTNIVYAIMLAFSIPHVVAFGGGMKLLDMLPVGYELEYVQELFTALGEEGRNAYLSIQLPIDMLYPILFAISYCFLLAWLLQKINKQHSWLFYLCYLPLIAGAADYLENIGIITLLNQFPDLTQQSVQITSLFSVVKSSTTSVYFFVVLIVLILSAWYRLSKRK
jgi:hypothetical protein